MVTVRTKARKDSNHKEIVEAFRAHGFYVLDISQLKNCADLIVTKGAYSTLAIEIKDGAKVKSAQKLTEGEEKFQREWKGQYAIVRTIGDVAVIASQINNGNTEN